MCHSRLQPKQEIKRRNKQSGRQKNCDSVKHSPRMAWELSFLISNQQKSCCKWKPAQAQVCTKHIFTKLNRHRCLHHVKIIMQHLHKLQKASIALKHLSYSNYTVWQQSFLSYFNFPQLLELAAEINLTLLFFLFFFSREASGKVSLIVLFLIELQTKNVILVIFFKYCTPFFLNLKTPLTLQLISCFYMMFECISAGYGLISVGCVTLKSNTSFS